MISRARQRPGNLLSLLIICCLGIIIYSNTLTSTFHFDDNSFIISNYSIRNITHLNNIWHFWPTRFVTFLTFALNYHFGGLNVTGYHIVNITIHCLAAMLVYWLALLLMRTPAIYEERRTGRAQLVALIAGLIFVSHPIQTEAVTYIYQRAASLTALLYLLTLCTYLHARLLNKTTPASLRRRGIFYIASFCAALLAVFSKENAVTLPLAILLIEFSFFPRHNRRWSFVAGFALIVLVSLITLFRSKPMTYTDIDTLIQGPQAGYHYLLTQFRVIITYARLLILPVNQCLDYDYPIITSATSNAFLSGLIFIGFLFMIAVRIFSRYRLISFAIIFFFITLLPESGIVPLADVIFEHRLYLPMTSFALIIASIIYYVRNERYARLITITSFTFIAFLACMTFGRNAVWRDDLTLWGDTLLQSPGKARVYNGRGYVLMEQGAFASAMQDFRYALKINPSYAAPYLNLGLCHHKQRNLDIAMRYYTKALSIDPHYASAYYNCGIVHDERGATNNAIACYTKAIELNSAYADAYNNRGAAYRKRGDFNRAMADFTMALKLDPSHSNAYYNRAIVYDKEGDTDKAITYYTKALIEDPRAINARGNRADAYCKKGYLVKAIADYTAVIDIQANSYAYYNRGNAYHALGDQKNALADYDKAIEMNPQFGEARNNRGVILYEMGDYARALDDIRIARSLGYAINKKLADSLENKIGLRNKGT